MREVAREKRVQCRWERRHEQEKVLEERVHPIVHDAACEGRGRALGQARVERLEPRFCTRAGSAGAGGESDGGEHARYVKPWATRARTIARYSGLALTRMPTKDV